MPVTIGHCQTPPPMVEETSTGEIMVTKQLQELHTTGFSGTEKNCLKLLTSPSRMVFPLGSSLVVRSLETGEQQLHVGHRLEILYSDDKVLYFLLRHPITCITLSDSGKYLATGETASLGTRAMVVCWDTSTWAQVGSHQTHHAKVQYLAISPDDSKVWNPLK